MRGFVSQAGRISAQLAGALKIHSLLIEDPYQSHRPIHSNQFAGILGEGWERCYRPASGLENLPVVNLEFRNRLHARIMPGPEEARFFGGMQLFQGRC
jgi:hypothetical protein